MSCETIGVAAATASERRAVLYVEQTDLRASMSVRRPKVQLSSRIRELSLPCPELFSVMQGPSLLSCMLCASRNECYDD